MKKKANAVAVQSSIKSLDFENKLIYNIYITKGQEVFEVRKTENYKVSSYTMKMKIYPSSEQRDKINTIFRALHIAYNMTFHEVFEKNPEVCTAPNQNGDVWPDFKKMVKKEWRHYLISQNATVGAAPADSLMGTNGLFALDAKKAWENGMKKSPVIAERRKDFRFYNSEKPRNSFFIQLPANKITVSEENSKVAFIHIPGVNSEKGDKPIKARGFNHKVRFGEKGQYSFAEAVKMLKTSEEEPISNKFSARISKDTCGDYFISITFYEGKKQNHPVFLQLPCADEKAVHENVGIDVGIKDVAILSTGQKTENKHFKQQKSEALAKLNRQLSRKWGPANMAYRDYNSEIRKENRKNGDAPPKPLSSPSKKYIAAKKKKALIERKVARRRDTYYHQQTANIVRHTKLIAAETLFVSNMMRNHKLAKALSDAAMSDFIEKLEYKAERFNVEIRRIGTFEPTSQLCSSCGLLNPKVKDLGVRRWTCPGCGTSHDRDINAAKNILKIAIEKGGIEDKVLPKEKTQKSNGEKPPEKRKSRNIVIFPDRPEIAVVFSKELSKEKNPRYVIKNTKTNKIIDDAQGAGYRSASNAKNCYKAKIKYSIKQQSNNTNS